MTGTGAGAPAAPAPGRAAYEARMARMGGRRDTWDELPATYRDIEEAGAQAAVEAFARQPAPLVVSISGKLTEAGVARLRKKFAEAVRTEQPRVHVDPDDLLIAAERARDEAADEARDEAADEARDLRDELDSLTGRVDGLVTEGGELRGDLERHQALVKSITAAREMHADQEVADGDFALVVFDALDVFAAQAASPPAAGDSRDGTTRQHPEGTTP